MSKRQDSAVILGVYGKGNFGDEALLAVVADDLRQVLPGCEMYVFCSGPDMVTRRFGFHALTRTPVSNFRRKLAILRRSRLLVVGGGTLLCDHGGGLKDAIAIVTYFFWLWVARLFGVPTLAYGQGFGPARGRIIRLGLWLLRSGCNEVTVRDCVSYKLLIGVAGRRKHFHLGADLVAAADRYLPETVRNRVDPDVAARVQELQSFVLLAVRYPKLDSLERSRDYLEGVGTTAAGLCKYAGVNVVLFPTHLSDGFVDDRPIMHLLERMLVQQGIFRNRIAHASWQSLDDAAYWLQSADMVFGDRLHAMLVAALNHVPVACVAVESKLSGCFADLFQGQPLAVVLDPDNVAQAGSQRLVQDLWDRRGSDPVLYASLLADYRIRRKANIDAIERAFRLTMKALP